MNDWGKACDRGRFEMTVRTRARVEADRIAHHPEAFYVGEVRSDDEECGTTQIGFVSLAAVLAFIGEMAPRTIDVLAAPDEDAEALAAVLTRGSASLQ